MNTNKEEIIEITEDTEFIEELLTEKANLGSMPDLLFRFYEHIIKFVYNQEHQRSQWVTSIMQSIIMMREFIANTSNLNKFMELENKNNIISKSFSKGYNKCLQDNEYITQEQANTIYLKFNKIEDITNSENIRSYLIQYAKNNNIIDAINQDKWS